ncbi:MAG: hypothetical protein KF912_11710 [Phycisphaeraceae bacterium]|nr:hypothetical protein [Phycisphaeraceae bacterium]
MTIPPRACIHVAASYIPGMIASPDLTHESPHHATPADTISPRQRWAHLLVLDMLRANLPLDRLAAHLNIPFLTLIDYINTPEVQAEIDAYDQLLTIRARLLGQTARPISLRKLLDVLESPAPQPTGRDPDADQRALHRHAELIRRTATTIARESRALVPKPAPETLTDQRPQKGAPSASSGSSCSSSHAPDTPTQPAKLNRGTANVTERTSSSASAPATKPAHTPTPDQRAQKGAPSASSGSSSNGTANVSERTTSPDAEDARHRASPEPVDARRPHPTGSTDPANAAADAAHPAQPAPAPSSPSPSAPSASDPPPSAPSPLRPSAPSFLSPPRHSALSANSAVPRSHRARDRPAA